MLAAHCEGEVIRNLDSLLSCPTKTIPLIDDEHSHWMVANEMQL